MITYTTTPSSTWRRARARGRGLAIGALAVLAAALLGASGCVSQRDVSDKACPCAAGWRCCAGDNVCVAADKKCPDGTGPVDDDELVISGSVCTSTTLQVVHPVKVLLIVDSSGSMQFTDPSDLNTTVAINGSTTSAKATCLNTCQAAGLSASKCIALCSGAGQPKRQAAATALFSKLQDNPAVSFAVVRFNSTVTVNGGMGETFTRDLATLQAAVSSLGQADGLTDYEGALRKGYEMLEKDIKATGAAERYRTRYVVMFFSDGLPDPRCSSGCSNDLYVGPGGSHASWCDLSRTDWCDAYSVSGPPCDQMRSWFPALQRCADYNSDPRVRLIARDIAQLKDSYGVGGVSFNTALLSQPTLPQPMKDLLALETSGDNACTGDGDCTISGQACIADPSDGDKRKCKSKVEQLLIAMAKEGNGQYGSFAADTVDFLLFDYSSLFKPFGMTQLIVSNTNVRPGAKALEVDSDGDGLSDALEKSLGLDPNNSDSDGDGYGDRVEYALKDKGCDPALASKPADACPAGQRRDDDGDGLNACEERLLGTSALLVDTDRDRIPDGIEVRWGTDPLTIDDKDDVDFDGKLSGDEIRQHTDPLVDDSAAHADAAYHYTVKQMPGSADRKCFEFTVRGVRLGPNISGGANHIFVTFGEAPTDVPQDYGNFKVACVRALLGADGKVPSNGQVTLTDSDFDTPYAVSSALASGDPKADPCKGAPLGLATPQR